MDLILAVCWVPVIPSGRLLEHVEEDNQGELASSDKLADIMEEDPVFALLTMRIV